MSKKLIYTSIYCLVFFSLEIMAQDTTRVVLRLKLDKDERLPVNIFAPEISIPREWIFIIPNVIPGTYMRSNYRRAYRDFKAFDVGGVRLRVKRKGNHIIIEKGERPFYNLSYSIKESLNKGPLWDRVPGWGSTIFTDSSFLFNFQSVTGYFEGFKTTPFEVIIHKNKNFYGAGALNKISSSLEKDIFSSSDYAELIDNPILYAYPDTTSVTIQNHVFNIAVHSEKGIITANHLKPAVKRIMSAIDSFSGFTTQEDYYFLFYFVNTNRLSGIFKRLGLDSALEHNNSSVYYFSDSPIRDTLFLNLDGIVSHEYFHTIAPLTVHSEKIHDFDFDKPNMSKHGWLYEGVTEYFSLLLNSRGGGSKRFEADMAYAIDDALSQKRRSLTKSSANVIRRSIFDWPSKAMQLSNFYSRGKTIAFWLDMELMERGEKRLIDVLLEIRKDYKGRYIPDNKMLDVLAEYTFPELRDEFSMYIEGKDIIPYQKLLQKLGWEYLPENARLPFYSKEIFLKYDRNAKQYYVRSIGKNTVGLRDGDVLIKINGFDATEENVNNKKIFKALLQPLSHYEVIEILVNRDGKDILLSGSPTLQMNIKNAKIIESKTLTEDQKDVRRRFFN